MAIRNACLINALDYRAALAMNGHIELISVSLGLDFGFHARDSIAYLVQYGVTH
jgi:hypothetical protein